MIRPDRNNKDAWRGWVAYCHENSPSKFLASKPLLGKPQRAPTWCPECSSTASDTFNWNDVYIFPSHSGPRIKCVQCLTEWLGRRVIK